MGTLLLLPMPSHAAGGNPVTPHKPQPRDASPLSPAVLASTLLEATQDTNYVATASCHKQHSLLLAWTAVAHTYPPHPFLPPCPTLTPSPIPDGNAQDAAGILYKPHTRQGAVVAHHSNYYCCSSVTRGPATDTQRVPGIAQRHGLPQCCCAHTPAGPLSALGQLLRRWAPWHAHTHTAGAAAAA